MYLFNCDIELDWEYQICVVLELTPNAKAVFWMCMVFAAWIEWCHPILNPVWMYKQWNWMFHRKWRINICLIFRKWHMSIGCLLLAKQNGKYAQKTKLNAEVHTSHASRGDYRYPPSTSRLQNKWSVSIPPLCSAYKVHYWLVADPYRSYVTTFKYNHHRLYYMIHKAVAA